MQKIKKTAWERFCSQLDPQAAATKIHQYISKLNGYNKPIDDRKYDICINGRYILSDGENTELFAEQYKNEIIRQTPRRPPFCILPKSCLHKLSLEKPFLLEEIERAIDLSNHRSTPGNDDMHIKWIT